MHRYVSARNEWVFPEIKLGRELALEELEAIKSFRLNQYRNDATYLVPKDENEQAREDFFDLNSYHITAKNLQGEVIGSLRLLKRPFELEHLNLDKKIHDGLDEYLEISRLICTERKQGLGRRLLIRAGLWSIEKTAFRGFTAICKCHRLPMFKRFGLIPTASFKISERGGQTYHLIRADFTHITMITCIAYLVSSVLKKPLL